VILSLIVAAAENGVIGAAGDLPWRLPDDLKRFKALTLGHPVLMGRRTWESIGRALPGRRSIVVTRNRGFRAEGAVVVHSLDDGLAACGDAEEAFVIGGAGLFREALPRADRLYLTRVHARVEGDVSLPELDLTRWELAREERHPADDRHRYAFSFLDYRRA
jgi:dihydrofolate reductase